MNMENLIKCYIEHEDMVEEHKSKKKGFLNYLKVDIKEANKLFKEINTSGDFSIKSDFKPFANETDYKKFIAMAKIFNNENAALLKKYDVTQAEFDNFYWIFNALSRFEKNNIETYNFLTCFLKTIEDKKKKNYNNIINKILKISSSNNDSLTKSTLIVNLCKKNLIRIDDIINEVKDDDVKMILNIARKGV